MINASHFIKVIPENMFLHSLVIYIHVVSLKGANEEHILLRRLHRACLEALYAALLISTRELLFSSINGYLKGIANSS
jgi:hypothetical protein